MTYAKAGDAADDGGVVGRGQGVVGRGDVALGGSGVAAVLLAEDALGKHCQRKKCAVARDEKWWVMNATDKKVGDGKSRGSRKMMRSSFAVTN